MQLGQNAARLLDVPNTPTKILKIERGSEAYGLQIPNLVSSHLQRWKNTCSYRMWNETLIIENNYIDLSQYILIPRTNRGWLNNWKNN